MSKAGKLYAIEEFIEERCREGQVEYLVKWLGYSSKSNSWVPKSSVEELPQKKLATKKTTTKRVLQSKTNRVTKANRRATQKSNTELAVTQKRNLVRLKKRVTKETTTKRVRQLETNRVNKTNPRTTQKSNAKLDLLASAIQASYPTGNSRKTTKRVAEPSPVAQTTATTAPKARRFNAKYYEIERLLAKRTVADSKVEYLVHWKGFSRDDSTWEPENCLKRDYCQMYCYSLRKAFLD